MSTYGTVTQDESIIERSSDRNRAFLKNEILCFAVRSEQGQLDAFFGRNCIDETSAILPAELFGIRILLFARWTDLQSSDSDQSG